MESDRGGRGIADAVARLSPPASARSSRSSRTHSATCAVGRNAGEVSAYLAARSSRRTRVAHCAVSCAATRSAGRWHPSRRRPRRDRSSHAPSRRSTHEETTPGDRPFGEQRRSRSRAGRLTRNSRCSPRATFCGAGPRAPPNRRSAICTSNAGERRAVALASSVRRRGPGEGERARGRAVVRAAARCGAYPPRAPRHLVDPVNSAATHTLFIRPRPELPLHLLSHAWRRRLGGSARARRDLSRGIAPPSLRGLGASLVARARQHSVRNRGGALRRSNVHGLSQCDRGGVWRLAAARELLMWSGARAGHGRLRYIALTAYLLRSRRRSRRRRPPRRPCCLPRRVRIRVRCGRAGVGAASSPRADRNGHVWWARLRSQAFRDGFDSRVARRARGLSVSWC